MKQTIFMYTPSRRILACALTLLWSAAPSFAQLAPVQIDPGALQRQEEERRRYIEEQNQRRERPAPVLEVPAEPAPAVPLSGTKFLLTDVLFSPSTLLGQEELQAIAVHYVGRDVDFAALARLVEEVNALYREHGVVTGRAVIGAQKIAHGVVNVTLVEAKLEHITVQGNSYTHGDYVSAPLVGQEGQTLDTRLLEARILRFNRASDLRVDASLRPGSSVGATDLILNVVEPPRYQTRLFFNNEGARSVGAAQAGIDTAMNGPFGVGDKLSVYLAKTRGATTGSLTYAIPVNSYGGRLTGSYNQGITEVIAGPYQALDISGKSKTLQFGLVQPVWHTGAWWFDLAGTTGKTRSDNDIGGVALSHTDVVNAALGATAAATWDQRSINLAFTGTHAREQALNKPERSFDIRQFRANWVESLGAASYGVLRAAAQDTNAVILTPSLLFQLGGTGTVRGYEVGALSGDRGYLVNAEFHHAPRPDIDASVFADFGEVRTAGVPRQVGKSVGAAGDFQLRGAYRGNLTVARTLNQVLPDQARWRVTGRVSYEF